MARFGVFWVALFAFTIGLPAAAGYGERVFNANESTSASAYPIDTGLPLLGPEHRAAQSFTPVAAFVLQNVTLRVQNEGSSQADVLNVTVQGDAAGSPDEAAVAWSQRARSGTGWLDLPLTPQPVLAANQKYWIVARSMQSGGDGYLWFHSDSDLVPGEAKTAADATWSVSDVTDMTYVAYGIRLEPLMSVGLAADRRTVAPRESLNYTIYVNNTGSRNAPNAWVNLTLDPQESYVSDTAAAINGVRTPPASWRITQLPNGPNAFVVTVAVDPAATGSLAATAHLDYTDSAGSPQPSSTAATTVPVALNTKPMYLAHDGSVDLVDDLQAAPPTGTGLSDFDGDGNPGTSIRGPAVSWTLSPALSRPFRVRGAISLELFVNAGNPSDTSEVNVTLIDRRGVVATAFAWAQPTITVDAIPGSFEAFSIDLGFTSRYMLPGNVTELTITKVAFADLFVAYNTTAVPSRLVVGTDTYISIDAVSVADDRGPALLFSARDNVNVRVNVSDPFGSGEIAGVAIDLTDPDGATVVTAGSLTLVATDPSVPSAWKRFAYVYPNPQKQGDYSFRLTAREGNGVESTASGVFTVRYPAIGLSVSQDVQSARRDGLVRFGVSFDNEGEGSGPVWINATLPPQLEFVSDTSGAIGGAKSGTLNWSFPDVGPGPHEFDLAVRVLNTAPNGTISGQFDLTFEDEKGFLWFAGTVVRDLEVLVPVPPVTPPNPWILALLGAAVVGAPLAGYWLWRSRRPAIEEAFLIHSDGILIYHLSRSIGGEGEKDRDILGAMLTAVQDFVKDSFRYGENRELNKLEFGDYRVLIERGKDIFLAVVLSSTTGEAEIRRKVRQVLGQVEAKFGTELAQFRGEMDRLLGVRDIVKALVGRK